MMPSVLPSQSQRSALERFRLGLLVVGAIALAITLLGRSSIPVAPAAAAPAVEPVAEKSAPEKPAAEKPAVEKPAPVVEPAPVAKPRPVAHKHRRRR